MRMMVPAPTGEVATRPASVGPYSPYQIEVLERFLKVQWEGFTAHVPWLWLVDNEPAAFHPQTEERHFNLLSVSEDIRPVSVVTEGGDIVVQWPGRGEPSRVPAQWLRANAPGRRRPDPANIPPLFWNHHTAEQLPRFVAADILTSDEVLYAWMRDTARTGLSIVEKIDGGPKGGLAVAERCGFIRRTTFGETFEVYSKPDPNNLAYTAEALALHTDLANEELPPGYQFLHCISNEATGGGSIFSDGFAAAEQLRATDPAAFQFLSEVEIPYRFHDRDADIRGRFPVIVCRRDGSVQELRFNAHLVDVIDLEGAQLIEFYRAYRKLMRMVREPAFGRTLRLGPGEMAVFDNRRILHGRQSFEPNTGHRYLHGSYVDRGTFLSRIRVLARAIPVDTSKM